jgi:hypothetical protein
MTEVRTQLGQVFSNTLFPALANYGIIKTMSVVRKTFVSDGAGGRTQTGTTNAYTNIPVDVKIDGRGGRFDLAGKLVTKQTYILEFPPQTSAGVQIAIDLDTDYFVANAMGLEPAVTYHIASPAEDLTNKFYCITED